MHSYDSSRAPSSPGTIAPVRAVRDLDGLPAAASHTPIYDALYSEYLRSFRSLPGDRSGEENLGFTSFSYGSGYTGGPYGGWSGPSWQSADAWQPAYVPQPPHQPEPAYSYAGGAAYASGRQHQTGMTHIPAALPPAPRRGY
ncbi:hypothetical protein AB0P12_30995 [Streptomyces subrutilus]|uniref:hypothetical protein n=1 Tax=Streptomyces subrutilus TaxID=36818 RepID=UPI0033C56464